MASVWYEVGIHTSGLAALRRWTSDWSDVDRSLYWRSSATSTPDFLASSFSIFPLSAPKRVLSYVSPTVLIFTFLFFSKSRKKSNIAWLKCSSWGDVRKNHLRPRRVNPGDDDSAFMNGMP